MVRERRWLVHSLLRVPKPQHKGRTCASRLGQTTLSSRQSSTGCSPISSLWSFAAALVDGVNVAPSRFVSPPQRRTATWSGRLVHAGHSYSIPGRVTSPAYELSLEPYSAGSLAPELQFQEDGTTSTGREGVYGDAVTVSAGVGLPISLWARDRGERPNGRLYPVAVTWQRHQGPAAVDFGAVSRAGRERAGEGSEFRTIVTFREPGSYILRARVDNFRAPDSGFDYNCCWSNAYLPVTVVP